MIRTTVMHHAFIDAAIARGANPKLAQITLDVLRAHAAEQAKERRERREKQQQEHAQA